MSHDIQHTVSDAEVLQLRCHMPDAFWVASKWWYRQWFSFCLERALTLEETDSVLSRINGFGPRRYEDTWESIQRRSDFDTTAFWRSKV